MTRRRRVAALLGKPLANPCVRSVADREATDGVHSTVPPRRTDGREQEVSSSWSSRRNSTATASFVIAKFIITNYILLFNSATLAVNRKK